MNLRWKYGIKRGISRVYFREVIRVVLKGKLTYNVPLGTDIHGNTTRLDNEIARFEDNLERCRESLENAKTQLEAAKIETQKPFPKEQELVEKTARLGELNALLDIEKKTYDEVI